MNKKDLRRRNIIIAGIMTIVILIPLMFILFKNEIAEKKKQRELDKIEWNADTLGKVETAIDPEATQQPKEKTIEDSLGNTYKEINYFNMDYNVYLPTEWKMTTSNGIIKAIDDKKESDTYQVEISIIPLYKYTIDKDNPLPSLWALRNQTNSNIQYSYKYMGYNDEFTATTFIMTKTNKPKNGLLYQPMDVTMTSKKNVRFRPHVSCYYKYINNRGFCILVTGHEDLEASIEAIAKTVSENFTDNVQPELPKTDPIVLNKTDGLGKNNSFIEFGINNEWNCIASSEGNVINASETRVYRVTNDITSPFYGLTISVVNVPKSDLDLRSYDDYTDYIHYLSYLDMPEMYTAMKNENSRIEYTIYSEEAKTTESVKGRIYDYQKYYNYASKDAEYRAIEMSSDIDGNICFICPSKKESVDVIFNIAYNDKNQELAKYVLDRIIDSIKLEE